MATQPILATLDLLYKEEALVAQKARYEKVGCIGSGADGRYSRTLGVGRRACGYEGCARRTYRGCNPCYGLYGLLWLGIMLLYE